jgi:DNA-directed RNA polymerase subunit F
MVKIEVLKEEPISMNEVKTELEAMKKRDKELNFRSTKTEEYLNQFLEYPAKTYEEIRKKIEALKITRLKPEMLVKILDVLPRTIDDMKNLLQGFVVSLSNEDMKKIIKVIEETAPPK